MLTIDRVPAIDEPDVALRLPPRLMLPVWLAEFQVKLPNAWPSPPGAVVVAPVTFTVDVTLQVAVGIVPSVWLCWYVPPAVNPSVLMVEVIAPALITVPATDIRPVMLLAPFSVRVPPDATSIVLESVTAPVTVREPPLAIVSTFPDWTTSEATVPAAVLIVGWFAGAGEVEMRAASVAVGTTPPPQLPAVLQSVETAPVQRRPTAMTMALLPAREVAAFVAGRVSVALLPSASLMVAPLRVREVVAE